MKKISVKHCKKCNQDTERYSSGNCKICSKKSVTEYRLKNPELQKTTKAAYRAANKDKVYALGVAWRAANKEKKVAYSADHYQSNAVKYNARMAAWRNANPEACRIYEQNYQARKIANGGKLSKDISQKLLILQKNKCPVCNELLGNDYHLDHVMPLALGGANIDGNIQLLHPKCNQQKNAKHPIDFMQQRGYLL